MKVSGANQSKLTIEFSHLKHAILFLVLYIEIYGMFGTLLGKRITITGNRRSWNGIVIPIP
jgi:hypothetical protein